MPHAAKPLRPLDVEAVKVLQKMIDTSGVSRARIAIAAHTGLSVNTLKSYLRKDMLPAPDAVIESPTGQIRGWTQETIDEWMTSRPGRGNRMPHK